MSKHHNKSRLYRKYKWWLRDKPMLKNKGVRVLLAILMVSAFFTCSVWVAAAVVPLIPVKPGTQTSSTMPVASSQQTQTADVQSEGPVETTSNSAESSGSDATDRTETDRTETDNTETETTPAETTLESTSETTPQESSEIDDTPGYYLFIGDSRTDMLNDYHLGDPSRDIFIAEVGACYEWFRDTAVPEARKVLQEKKINKVFINMGVNDACYAHNHAEEHPENKYSKSINELAAEFPNVKFYFYSVGYGAGVKYGNIVMDEMNAYLDVFNAKMEELCAVSYIPLCEYLKATGYVCTDNLHYNYDTCKKIYEFVVGYSIDSSIFVR